MNRSRRPAKQFVPGGVYDPTQTPVKEVIQQPAVPAASPAPRNYSFQNVAPKKQVPAVVQPQQQQLQDQQKTQELVLQQQQLLQQQQQQEEELIQTEVKVDSDDTMQIETDENGLKKGKVLFKKIFQFRKKSSVRLKEKRLRQNRQLRKVILPKNALMALNEVKGITIGDFIITSNTGGGFTAVVTVNDNQYEGKGTSKILAKNNACEKALRDLVITRMRKFPRRGSISSRPVSATGETPMETDVAEINGDGDGDESQKDEAGEVPMINLASFALYKLFSEWENEGYEIPEFHPTTVAPTSENGSPKEPKEPKKAPIRTELPANWETLHPATLLCMMRPGVTYSELGTTGEKPNILQTLGVVVDGNEFQGTARSKKVARRNAAVNACNSLFGTNFSLEESAPITTVATA